MDDLRTAFAEAKAQSLKLLGRKTDTVNVARRAHYDDGILSVQSRDTPKKIHPPLTVADVEAIVEEKINRHAEIWREVIGQVIAQERKRHRAEVGKLRSDHDLRISGLAQSVDKLEHGNGDRGEVIELPTLPLRSSRRA
jgi:hypothetical protein